jgi:hypothetical protein
MLTLVPLVTRASITLGSSERMITDTHTSEPSPELGLKDSDTEGNPDSPLLIIAAVKL